MRRNIDFSEIGLEKAMTDVMASTAQLSVDFDGALNGQSNINKKIATLTKYNPSGTTVADRYGKVYLGELLKTAGLTYTFDTLGFIEINKLKRDKNNVWVTQFIHPQTAGGTAADTVEVRMGVSAFVLLCARRDIRHSSVSGYITGFYLPASD
ncbi:MAG: hypothetical protein GX640_24255, partial [Fibrobacter sp.]|nr:hypothetical protein [Fibrobacter sp.]